MLQWTLWVQVSFLFMVLGFSLGICPTGGLLCYMVAFCSFLRNLHTALQKWRKCETLVFIAHLHPLVKYEDNVQIIWQVNIWILNSFSKLFILICMKKIRSCIYTFKSSLSSDILWLSDSLSILTVSIKLNDFLISQPQEVLLCMSWNYVAFLTFILCLSVFQ